MAGNRSYRKLLQSRLYARRYAVNSGLIETIETSAFESLIVEAEVVRQRATRGRGGIGHYRGTGRQSHARFPRGTGPGFCGHMRLQRWRRGRRNVLVL